MTQQIKTTFEVLFQAISELENHEFEFDKEYFQLENIFIENVNTFIPIKGMIKKQSECQKLYFEDNTNLECANKHILFDQNNNEILTENVKIGDKIKTKNGLLQVFNKIDTEYKEVYDLEVDSEDHTYCDANGIIHHNSLLTASISWSMNQVEYQAITVVPSLDLVEQTYEWYKKVGLDVGKYCGSEKDIHHMNVISTWQSLQNNPLILDNFQTVIWDECFSGHQKVLTSNGPIEISKIKVGDLVYSRNKNGEVEFNEVEKVYENLVNSSTSKMIKLYFENGDTIEVTENHEFYTKHHGKVKAKDLTEKHDIVHIEEIRKNYLYTINKSISNFTNTFFLTHSEYNKRTLIKLVFSNGLIINERLGYYRKQLIKCQDDYFLEHIDDFLSNNEEIRNQAVKTRKTINARKANSLVKNRVTWKKGNIPWNTGTKGEVKCWSKGLTKDTHPSLKKLSESRLGENNPMFGKKLSDQQKKNLSEIRLAQIETREIYTK